MILRDFARGTVVCGPNNVTGSLALFDQELISSKVPLPSLPLNSENNFITVTVTVSASPATPSVPQISNYCLQMCSISSRTAITVIVSLHQKIDHNSLSKKSNSIPPKLLGPLLRWSGLQPLVAPYRDIVIL